MRDTTIARNYAETLLVLAGRANDAAGWGRTIRELADAVTTNATMRLFLESPRVPAARKSEVLAAALAGRVPPMMVRFLQQLVANRRQTLIPQIADEYQDLLDAAEGRLHARVTLAQEPSDADRTALAEQLSRVFGKQVIPHVTVDPAIMGGVVVNVGDTVLDGSVRKRLGTLRRRMLTGK